MDIVVAHYNENLDWLAPYAQSPDFRVTIYAKGGLTEFPGAGVIPVPNVGREAETFARHILRVVADDDREGAIAFLQGNPLAHAPRLDVRLCGLADYAVCNAPIPLGEIIACDGRGRPHEDFPVLDCYNAITNASRPDAPFYFAAGAQYLLPKSLLFSRPKEDWERLYVASTSPAGPWIVERLWWELFRNV